MTVGLGRGFPRSGLGRGGVRLVAGAVAIVGRVGGFVGAGLCLFLSAIGLAAVVAVVVVVVVRVRCRRRRWFAVVL